MIISISGKAGSGKDEVGKIIQEFLPEFEIKKWATKVKEIVSLLIGCSMEDLENRDFKEKELGEEWWYWKDKKLNKICCAYLETSYQSENHQWTLIKLTPRKLLQLMGTEAGREILHPNLWVIALMREYKGFNLEAADESLTVKGMYFHTSCDNCEKSFTGYKRQFLCKDCTDKLNPIMPNWIITDSRFANELKAVEDRGGITIRVNRPGLIENNHPSEISLDSATFDYVVYNNSDITSLRKKVKIILQNEGIL